MKLRTHPEVFHPLFFHSTLILLDAVEKLPLRGKRILDMGTGTGVIGIIASRAGAEVLALDINPRAVELAKANAVLNTAPLNVMRSDLFSEVGGDTFDYIVFNVPFFQKPAVDLIESAFNAGKDFATVRRFASEAAAHLRPTGVILVVFSELSGYEAIVSIFRDAGLRPLSSAIRQKFFEKFYTVSFGTTLINAGGKGQS